MSGFTSQVVNILHKNRNWINGFEFCLDYIMSGYHSQVVKFYVKIESKSTASFFTFFLQVDFFCWEGNDVNPSDISTQSCANLM